MKRLSKVEKQITHLSFSKPDMYPVGGRDAFTRRWTIIRFNKLDMSGSLDLILQHDGKLKKMVKTLLGREPIFYGYIFICIVSYHHQEFQPQK